MPIDKKVFDRELELKKIEVVKEDHQRYFTTGSSILTGGFTALLVLIITLYYSQKLDLVTALFVTILVGVVIAVGFLSIDIHYKRFYKRLDKWIEKIEKEEPLPSITEMKDEKI